MAEESPKAEEFERYVTLFPESIYRMIEKTLSDEVRRDWYVTDVGTVGPRFVVRLQRRAWPQDPTPSSPFAPK